MEQGSVSIEARKKAMRLLEHMNRTEKGLSDKLSQAGFSSEETEDAIAYVKKFGYVNDQRYAETYLMGRIHQKSRQKLMQELQQKGISREIISKAWDTVIELEEPDERGILRESIEKKYGSDLELDEKEMRRLYGYFVRRGFSFSDINSVLSELNIIQQEFMK